MLRKIFLMCCLIVSAFLQAAAQHLRESVREDTFYHFYPLDSAMLSHYYEESYNHDSLLFMSSEPIRIGSSKLSQASKLLKPGTYLRIHVSDLFIDKEVTTFAPFVVNYVADGPKLILFVQDNKTHLLRDDLHIYYKGKPALYDPGKGGYIVPWENANGMLLIRDKSADFAFTLSVNARQDDARATPFTQAEIQPAAGYMILSKPKYRPGDTLKAYTYQITGKNGRPVRRKITATVSSEDHQLYWQQKINKQKPGSYQLSLPIPDSFMLDQNYQLRFRYRKGGRTHEIARDFLYEDYHLDKANYDFLLDKDRYKSGDSITYFISARDESGFAQPFGKYTVDVHVRSIHDVRTDTFGVNIWHSIYHSSGELNGSGLESYSLPQNVVFPPGRSSLSATFRLINDLNEEKVITRHFEYDNTPFEFVFTQKEDSLVAEYRYLRKSTPKQIRYIVFDQQGDTVAKGILHTPAAIAIKTNHNFVRFYDDSALLYTLHVQHSLAEQLNLKAAQDKDSVRIAFRSLGARMVYYTIIKNGKVLLADSGSVLNFRAKSALSDNYEFTLSQATGASNTVQYNHWYILPERKKLLLTHNLPEKILPGSSVDVTVNVRDLEGNPRKRIDLSSYAIKNQFREASGSHCFYFTTPHYDTLFAQTPQPTFIVSGLSGYRYSSRKPLRSEEVALLNLHRYTFYRFFFPPDALFEEDLALTLPQTRDSIAQMSIQLIRGGGILSPVWIKADGRPIYYGRTARRNVAALPAGKHRIQLHAADKLLDLDTLDFRAGSKKIISISLDSLRTRSKSLVARDSFSALYLDSLTAKSILAHSYLSFAHPVKESSLQFRDMRLYLGPSDFNVAATDFLGSSYQFFGPFYNTGIARWQSDKDSSEWVIGSGMVHFYDPSGKMIKTVEVPRLKWPANTHVLSFNQVYDSLHYPAVAPTPYQDAYIKNNPPAQPDKKTELPLFGSFMPPHSGDSMLTYTIHDPQNHVVSLAIVPRNDIEKSWFYASGGSGQHVMPRVPAADLFFQLTDGRKIVYRNVMLQQFTHFYVNADSLKGDSATKEDLAFYSNVYSSLTSSFHQLFTNYPEKVKVGFEKNQKGRNSCSIIGRLIGQAYANENIYLENAGRFVAGTVTDASGNFRFLDIAPASYMVKIHPSGQRPVYVYNLSVQKGEQYNLNIEILQEENPVLLSAVNPHFELLVREKEEPGHIRLFDHEHHDLISGGRICFLMDQDTLLRAAANGYTFLFPSGQWPSGLPVGIVVTAPGYEPIFVKQFPAQPEFQYEWRMFLQPKLKKGKQESSIFINGQEIARFAPRYEVVDLDADSAIIRPGTGRAGISFQTVNDEELTTCRASIRVFRNQKLLQNYDTETGRLSSLNIPLDKGNYLIEFSSVLYQTQRIALSIREDKQYVIHLASFNGKERIAPLQALATAGVGSTEQNTPYHERYTSSDSYTQNAPPLPMKNVATRAYTNLASVSGGRVDEAKFLLESVTVQSGNADRQKKTVQPLSALSQQEASAMKANPLMQRLRNIFSDEAGFNPGMRTNKDGNVFFRVRFPDDITLWDMYQVALGRGYFFGESVSQVRSFKPVMASIRTPRYFYLGDSLELDYTFRNLLDDTKQAFWQARAGERKLLDHTGPLGKGLKDSVYITVSDTLSIPFYTHIQTADSFVDQELRTVPVKEQAIITHTDTTFCAKDTAFTIYRAPGESVKIRIDNSLVSYLNTLAEQLERYPYTCTEQQCSRLKGLIYQQLIAKRLGQPFRKQRAIRELIKELEQKQNSDGSFAWWYGEGNTEMTQIALDAFYVARNAGYTERGFDKAKYYLQTKIGQWGAQTLDILCALLPVADIKGYKSYFDRLESGAFSNPFDALRYQRLKAYYTDSFDRANIAVLLQQSAETVDTYPTARFTRSGDALLLRTFRLYRSTPLDAEISEYTKQYMQHRVQCNLNTYERALALEQFYAFTFQKESKTKSRYTIGETKASRQFPYTGALTEPTTTIRYTGSEAWVTVDRIRKQRMPAQEDTFFAVTSVIENQKEGKVQGALKLNEDYVLEAGVFNYLAYEHVMITIPLPSGISLKHKIRYPQGVDHIEYYNDRVVLYCSSLPAGQHIFPIPVRAQFRGHCIWPPVRAELMYRSEVYGHNTFRTIEIR